MIPARFAHVEIEDTLPRLLRHNARTHGADVALREKELGLWKSHSWTDFHDRARLWALALRGLGVGKGDVVAIVGDARPDWVAAAIGAHATGALTMGLYQEALESEIDYLVDLAEAKVVVAENEEQVDKMLRAASDAPSVRWIVYCDARGMRKYDDPRLVHRDVLLETARGVAAAEPGLWDSLVDATSGDDPAMLCSTSGTTSNPKLVTIASGRFIRHVAIYCDLFRLGPDDEYVSLLPMAWIGEQFQGIYQPLVCRHKVNFVENPETVMADLREIAPTFMFLAPRVWEQIAADVRARIIDASPFKRRMFQWGLDLALKAVERGSASWLAQSLVLRALRDRLGFTRLRFASTGGAAMGPDTFKFFMAMGLPMLQLYGQTELAGIYCTQRLGDVDFDAVGTGLGDDYKIRIDNPDANGVGEIVSAHPYMFSGYYRNEEATRTDLRDGWMYTGDAGYFKPSGQLVVVDRLRDLAMTVSGERFSPQFIENKLKFSPYISEAVILGDRRDHPAAIVCIRFAIVSKWAEQNRMSFTTYSDLSGRKEVYDLIAGEIDLVNASLPPAQRLRKFALLYKELDADDGELTRTRKVRRGVIAEKYADIIDAIYSGAGEVRIDTEIVFQDGSRQRVRTTLPVASLRGDPPAAAKSA
ncbi:AMP-binding protein [Reyranella sp.]|uniref:AMP-binding protein n=1 Tax=Reyranella sp. TaxID=1929291 RepID=UPI0027301962|nr:AMP-binding protein [Reyranella sp.]MDP2372537.1 AMP-binding protein [Reyranella sp.]